jgi:molybdate transport system ATP-binding protein
VLLARIQGRVGALELDVKLEATPGRLVLVGPNGAGKTSLLAMLLGALRPEKGRITLEHRVLFDDTLRVALPIEERRIGYVPQDFALFPHLNVAKNVEFALASRSEQRDPKARAARLAQILEELTLTRLSERDTRTLSGGEKQRVALARALATRPSALLLDEPLAALDIPARREVRTFLADYLGRLALPTLIVTHDARDARLLGDRIAVLEAGRITQLGTWSELVAHPASPFVEEFVASASD